MKIRVIIIGEAETEISFTFPALMHAKEFISELIEHMDRNVLRLRIEIERQTKYVWGEQ